MAKKSKRAPIKTSTKTKKPSKAKLQASSKAKKTKAAVENYIKLGENIWPIERDVLFRPDRFNYVRKLIKDEGCVFCLAAKGELSQETLCVYKSEHSMVVLNKFPYNSGHVLVIPRRHEGQFLDLSPDEYADLSLTLRMAVEVITKVYNPAGVNLGMNMGAVAGAGIPDHLHYHVVPRWSGDLNFFPLIAQTKNVIESLEQSYEKIRAAFKEFE